MKSLILNHRFSTLTTCLSMLVIALLLNACTPETRLLNKIPINSVDVKVLDQNDNPVAGAQVEASNGRRTTTDENGIAKVRFGSVGIHSVSVYADNHMPANFIVTMPADRGKTVTKKLANEISISGLRFGSINMYPLIFNYMFSSYGYSPELSEYREGQSTTWNILSEGDENASMQMYKAFLKKLDNGREWWAIKLVQEEDEPHYVAEVLFSEDRTSILRYREQIGDGEIQEKPVSEGWYSKPVSLTKESEEGGLKEQNVSVEVPAGSFTADLLEFGIAPKTLLRMWKATGSSVPGGVLKYETTSEGEMIYTSVLVDYSSDATTMLDSF